MEFSELPKRKLFGDSAAAKAARRFGAGVMCVTLLVTAAFGSGVYWSHLHAQGTPAHARMLLPDADEKVGKQMMFRMWEDIAASMRLIRAQAEQSGWRGSEARGYLRHFKTEALK